MQTSFEFFYSLKLIFLHTFLFGTFFFALTIILVYFLKSKKYLQRETKLWKLFTIVNLVFVILTLPSAGCIMGFTYGVHKESKKYSHTIIKPFLEPLYPVFLEYFQEKIKQYESLSLEQAIEHLKNSGWEEPKELKNKITNFKFFEYLDLTNFSTRNHFLSFILETIILFQAKEMGISHEQIQITKELIQALGKQRENPKFFEYIFQKLLEYWENIFYTTYLKLVLFMFGVFVILLLDCFIYKNRKSLFELA